jgi:SAM-dependent methyltransferase
VARDGASMVRSVFAQVRRVRRIAAPDEPPVARGGVFDEGQAATLAADDATHWWFRSKAAFVADAIQRHGPDLGPTSTLLDVGAGSGGVTAQLGWPGERLLGVEGSPVLAAQGHRGHSLPMAVGSVELLPVRASSFDVATALDVIEHVHEPEVVLREVARALKPGGLAIITVPAHPSLWSPADELLGHVRRYRRPLARQQAEACGLQVLELTHVFSWLVVPVWLHRRVASSPEAQLGLSQRSAVVDAAALVLTRLERTVTRVVSLPFGTSILLVARLPSDARDDPRD